MVRQFNVQQLLIICGTMVWHSPVLKVWIHLFELTSCMVQHIMVSYIINKNVFMVKLSNFSWQTQSCQHAHKGTLFTWMSYTRVYLGKTCTLNNSVLCFICKIYFSGTSNYAMRWHSFNQDFRRRPDKMPKVKPGQSRNGKNKASKTTTQRGQSSSTGLSAEAEQSSIDKITNSVVDKLIKGGPTT